ncbi:O-antigen translocase [Dysgonomonas reticulitermitis]
MKKETSYSQILKSTSIFGGSQVLVIIIGIVRAKAIALLLGPAGVGIIGIYQSIVDMLRTGCGLGLDTGGVREIAAANSLEDKTLLGKTIYRLNWWFLVAAFLGLTACLAFCRPISIWAFGTDKYVLPIVLLSIPVFLAILTTGRSVNIQGMRKVSYMAQYEVWGSLVGLFIALPLYYILGLKGIVPAFITTGLVLYFFVEFYYKKLNVRLIKIPRKEVLEAGLSTLKLGIFIVISGIISTAGMFLVRAYISRSLNVEAAGLFQSAWTITAVYLGLILKSMGADFFPRLSSIAEKKTEIKKLVNEQTYVVLVISVPVIIGMLLFSEFALSVLYSTKFANAENILQWQVLGSVLKLLSWPVAFIILAKKKGLLFLFSEVVFYISYLAVSYFLFPQYGLDAVGIGYLIAYMIYLPLIVLIGWRISGFIWSKEIMIMITIGLTLICVAFYISHTKEVNTWIFGSAVLFISLLYSFYKLKKVFSLEDLNNWFGKK